MSEQTFKVGDKVAHETYGPGVVKLGPYAPLFSDAATRYIVEMTDREGRCGMFDASSLKAVSAFEHGAKVVHRDSPTEVCTVVGGPFRYKYSDGERPWYVLENPDGTHETSTERYLSPAPAGEPIKVGDRVRVVEDDSTMRTGEFVGLTGVVTSVGSSATPFRVRFGDGPHGTRHGYWHCTKVERVADEPSTFEHRGIIYDLTAKYIDREGDGWDFHLTERALNGTPKARLWPGRWTDSLQSVVEAYGPLRKKD